MLDIYSLCFDFVEQHTPHVLKYSYCFTETSLKCSPGLVKQEYRRLVTVKDMYFGDCYKNCETIYPNFDQY